MASRFKWQWAMNAQPTIREGRKGRRCCLSPSPLPAIFSENPIRVHPVLSVVKILPAHWCQFVSIRGFPFCAFLRPLLISDNPCRSVVKNPVKWLHATRLVHGPEETFAASTAFPCRFCLRRGGWNHPDAFSDGAHEDGPPESDARGRYSLAEGAAESAAPARPSRLQRHSARPRRGFRSHGRHSPRDAGRCEESRDQRHSAYRPSASPARLHG